MKRINTEELHGLLLLNGFKPSESNRMFDSNPLLRFCKELNSPLRGSISSSLYFTKFGLKFIIAEYNFDFKSDMNTPLRIMVDELSNCNYYTIARCLKEHPFKFNCIDHFNHEYSLIYRPFYFSENLDIVKKYSYYLENKNIYLNTCIYTSMDAYKTEDTFFNIPIFLNGEECARYLHFLI